MSNILIAAKQSRERAALCLVLELAGHRCLLTDSLEEAARSIRAIAQELVLIDSSVVTDPPDTIVQWFRSISPDTAVLVLSEDASATLSDEVITHPDSPVQHLSTRFSSVTTNDALRVLLPNREALKNLNRLSETPGMLNRIAVLYHSQRKYSTAGLLYRRALKLCKAKPDSDDRETATLLHNLARLYHDEGRLVEAKALYLRSIAIAEKVFGPNHPKVNTRVKNLAELYLELGSSEKGTSLERHL